MYSVLQESLMAFGYLLSCVLHVQYVAFMIDSKGNVLTCTQSADDQLCAVVLSFKLIVCNVFDCFAYLQILS